MSDYVVSRLDSLLSGRNAAVTRIVFRKLESQGIRVHSTLSATFILISVNAVVFGAWQYAQYTNNRRLVQKLHDNFTLSWQNFEAGRIWTLLTSAFSHKDPGHFYLNMVAMLTFGRTLAFAPGVNGLYMAALALGSGLVGSLGFLYHRQEGRSKRKPGRRLDGRPLPYARAAPGQVVRVGMGASGATMGLGAAAACLMPTRPMRVMFIPIPVPLWIATIGYIGVDAYLLDSETSRVGHAAHLGGAVFGAAFSFVFLGGYGGVAKMIASRFGRR